MAFVPANFGTCILHLRASAAGVADGGAVSSATVLTGTTLTGQTGGNPTYDATSLLNNRPGIVYSRAGTDDGLYSASDYLAGVTSASFAMVCRFASVDATTQYLFDQTVPAPRLLRFAAYQVTGGVIGCYASSSGTSNEGLSAGSTIAVDTNYVIVGTVTFDAGGTAGTMKLWVNNSLVINKTDVAGTSFVSTASVNGLGVGYLASTGAGGFDGCINEFAMWSEALTDAEVVQVWSHLHNDYLTPANSPAQTVVMS